MVFVSLSLLSASNYTEVAYTKLSAVATADVRMAAARLDPSGEVSDNTVFWFNVTINITNPGSKTTKLQFITYQGAVCDYITQDLYGSGGQTIFYSSIIRTFTPASSQGFTAPKSRFSANVSWVFDHDDGVAFQGTKKILNYALTNSSHLLRWDQVEWNHYFVFQMIITGIPYNYYGPNSDYLAQLPIIRRYQGDNSGVR